jgi:apolipoprotein N-acyltransferase
MPFLFYLYGSSYKERFNSSDIINYEYKVRAIGSNISLDRFYSNIDPVSVINELIDISQPSKDDKTIFVWPEGILPDVSQEELIEFKWLFEMSSVQIIYYSLELTVKKQTKKKLIISIPYQFMIII